MTVKYFKFWPAVLLSKTMSPLSMLLSVAWLVLNVPSITGLSVAWYYRATGLVK